VFHIHSCIENTSTIFTHLFPLHLSSLYHSCPPFNILACYSSSSLSRHLFIFQWEFCLGISPVSILCLNQSNPSITLHNLFPLPCIIQQFSVCFFVSCHYIDVMLCHYFNHILSSLSSFSPPLVSSNMKSD
jgi:hypothetical protein